jgi:hypothetical protein
MRPVAIDIEEVNRWGAAMIAARRGGAVLARWGKAGPRAHGWRRRGGPVPGASIHHQGAPDIIGLAGPAHGKGRGGGAVRRRGSIGEAFPEAVGGASHGAPEAAVASETTSFSTKRKPQSRSVIRPSWILLPKFQSNTTSIQR